MEELKKHRKYFYDMDYNFYHNTGTELIRITRKEYKEKTGESDFIIDKLRNSIHPSQDHDYFFMKIKSKHADYAAIDWGLYNLVIYFNKNGFRTSNVSQTMPISKTSTSISSIHFVHPDKLLPFLKEKLCYDDIVDEDHYHDFRTDGYNFHTKVWKKFPHEDPILYTREHITGHDGKESPMTSRIIFENHYIYRMCDAFGIDYPGHTKAHTGGRIIRPVRFDKIKHLIKE